jgi:hypothetical protein
VRRFDLKPHWPDMPDGADISDWLERGHTREEFDALIEGAPDYELRQEKNGYDHGSDDTIKAHLVESGSSADPVEG